MAKWKTKINSIEIRKGCTNIGCLENGSNRNLLIQYLGQEVFSSHHASETNEITIVHFVGAD